MRRLYSALERLKPDRIVPDQKVAREYFLLLETLQAQLDVIRSTGVQVKDVATGLLDFPARREGRLVLLCWKAGEESLAFWHESGDGLSGRRPVDEDGPWEEA